MPDVFISYASEEEEIARSLHSYITTLGNTAFLASVSIPPGSDWSAEIKDMIRDSRCILFLATASACKSPFVQQELGMALMADRHVIPVLVDIDASALPGWMRRFQALDFRKISTEGVGKAVARFVVQQKTQALDQVVTIIAIAFLGWLLISRKK